MGQMDNHIPQVILPYDVKESIAIKSGKKEIIERVNIWKMKGNKFTFFPDILTKPLLLLSREAKEVLQIYEQKTIFRQVILFDEENKVTELYYLPMLPEINVKHREKNRIILSKKDLLMMKRASILKMREEEKICYIANLELIESFLKRGLLGIEIDTINFSDKEI